jgi:hypothetical protein
MNMNHSWDGEKGRFCTRGSVDEPLPLWIVPERVRKKVRESKGLLPQSGQKACGLINRGRRDCRGGRFHTRPGLTVSLIFHFVLTLICFRHSGRSVAETRNPAAPKAKSIRRLMFIDLARDRFALSRAAGFRVFGPRGPSPGMTKGKSGGAAAHPPENALKPGGSP